MKLIKNIVTEIETNLTSNINTISVKVKITGIPNKNMGDVETLVVNNSGLKNTFNNDLINIDSNEL